MKQYCCFVRDHSASMHPVAVHAARDYNANLTAIQNAARETGLDTILNVVECGVGWDAKIRRAVVNSNVYVVEQLAENKYETSGNGTPLFDSVLEGIDLMKNVPDANDPEVTFLVMVITDGQENRSRLGSKQRLIDSIKTLQATDRWTFVFRVPRGDKVTLVTMGIPEGNVLEWDQTSKGFEQATQVTTSAVASYYTNRTKGIRSTGTFYADLSKISSTVVKQSLNDITNQIKWHLTILPTQHDMAIKDVVLNASFNYVIGTCYYQLTKPEKIQDRKKIIIQDLYANRYYTGQDARSLLGLPLYGEVRVTPDNLGKYKIFVQSTSVNRKLVGNTTLLRYNG